MQEMTVQGTKVDIEEEVYTTKEQVDAEKCDIYSLLRIINWQEDDIERKDKFVRIRWAK